MSIAFDNSADLGIAAGSLTASYTNGGSVLLVGVVGDVGADNVSGVTYNGVSMTLLDKDNTGNRCAYTFILNNPATGSHNVVVSTSGSFIAAGALSYTAAKTSGQPDNHNESNQGVTNSATTSLTTVANNCWVTLFSAGYTANLPPGAGAGSTVRSVDGTFGTWGWFDSNGPISPAASYSMTATRSVNGNDMLEFMVSIVPAGGTNFTSTLNANMASFS